MSEQKTTCPSHELLSEYVDVEGTAAERDARWRELADHVKGCPECRKTLDGYRELNRLVCRVSAAPEDLAARIVAACRTPGRREAIRPFPWWRKAEVWSWTAKACAACVGLLLIGGLWLRLQDSGVCCANPMAEVRSGASYEPVGFAPVPMEVTSVPAETETDEVAMPPQMAIALNELEAVAHDEPMVATNDHELKLNGSVSTRDLRTVGSQADNGFRSNRTMRTYQLQENIRHIWNIDNFDLCLAELHRLDASGKYQLELDEQDPNCVRATFVGISDTQLQQLVDRFSKMKWALVSPFLPQPNESSLVEFTGKKVNYLLIGVRKK